MPAPPPIDGGVGAPDLGDNDAPSNGGSITFEQVGAAGWFPSRHDPAAGGCDAYQSDTCCLQKKNITSDALTPWDDDLILTLRGPMVVKQMAVYQPPAAGGAWNLVSAWDSKGAQGLAFDKDFDGDVGTECLVNVSTNQAFPCGAGSSPYCPGPDAQYLGWAGSKLFVVLAKMPHAGDVPGRCSKDDTGNWFDAPWMGLSVGELVRAGSFVSCQCYAKDQTKGYLADGCGQFNVFEVVNDNNSYKNLDVFSTNMIGYGGYVGEGPCGPKCDVSKVTADTDLIDKSNDTAATAGGISSINGTNRSGPGVALRRPENGYRYFFVLLDVASRTVQMALVHPGKIPTALSPIVPALPASVPADAIGALRDIRLPQ